MKARVTRMLSLAVMVVAGIAAGAAANDRRAVLPDSQIRALVEHRLAEKKIGEDVLVAVKDRVVTLSGQVPSLWVEKQAIDTTRKADDVRQVVNDLRVMRAESDQVVARDIARKVRRYVFYTIFDNVDGIVKDGVVTLTGAVTRPWEVNEIGDLVTHVSGVQRVQNDIQMLPVSPYDDQLRYTLARKIYGDPELWNYGLNPNPPIHIVVDNGRVTLTGAVGSQMDKTEAGIIARSTFGVFAVDNELKVAA